MTDGSRPSPQDSVKKPTIPTFDGVDGDRIARNHDGRDAKGRADTTIDRRRFVGLAAVAAGLLVAPPARADSATLDPTGVGRIRWRNTPRGFEFDEISLTELTEGMDTGRWTSRSIVDAYLDRIQEIDRAGPKINSVLETNPDARAIADALDAERKVKGPRSRLHGIPVLVKDSIGTADRMHTSAGSLALAKSIAPHDATLVEKLRAAGCVILGKSNMSEWANARGRSSVGGWSARGRLTRNPYVLDRSSGGSSSGTAAAVSANLAPVGIAAETMGSMMTPASMCGVVAFKPTVGLVSRAGIIPVSITQDSAGPMARTVRDAAIVLSAIAGPDPRDPMTADATAHAVADYVTSLDPRGLAGARIGVARNLFGVSLVADRVIERALGALTEAGATLVDPVVVENAEAVWTFDSEVLSYELKASLDEYLASLGPASPVKSLADLIAFNLANSDREMPWFGQETFLYAQRKGPLTSPGYRTALATVRTLAREQGIDATIAQHRLDALIAPTQSPAWLIDVLLGDNSALGAYVPAAAAGYPSVTVPAGDVSGLPVGMLFFGPAWSDAKLLRYAFAFEQSMQARRPPTFLPSIEVRP